MTALPFAAAAQEVKQRLDIVDVVGRSVVLRKAGRNYTGLCPFHNEKTPSFSVNREKQLFKCFGCGEGGDTLSFLMKLEKKTYGELIRDLADEFGIEIEADGRGPAPSQKGLNDKLYALNHEAGTFYQAQLKQSLEATSYLQARGLSPEHWERFQLGYAPAGWTPLCDYLHQQGQSTGQNDEHLVTAGLANHRLEGTGVYDRFRHRLMIPIHDDQGRWVGFGGRAFSDEDKPKYLNTSETPIYVKSRILYGLHQAKDAIRETGSVVVMEGYFDVMTAHLAGIRHAVGSCGTALTDQHLKLLVRYGAKHLYLAFDADAAGLKAAHHAIELIEKYLSSGELSVSVVVVPSGKDPDAYIRSHGASAFEALIATAVPFLTFKLESALAGVNPKDSQQRLEALNRVLPILASLQKPLLRADSLQYCADRLQIAAETLQLELQAFGLQKNSFSYKKNSSHSTQFAPQQAISHGLRRSLQKRKENTAGWVEYRRPLSPQVNRAAKEETLLALFLMNRDAYTMMKDKVTLADFMDPLHQTVFGAMMRPTAPWKEISEWVSGLVTTLMVEQSEPMASDAVQKVSDLVFRSEALAQSFGWETLSISERVQRLERALADCKMSLKNETKQNMLRQLADEGRRYEAQFDEAANIELQYQLKAQLAQKEP